MKNDSRRILLFSACAVLTLALASAALASCGSADTPASETAVHTESADLPGSAETETVRLMPELPDADYAGYTFRVIHWYYDQWASRACIDIYAEAENGDTINDAVYTRNLAVSDRYNINISLENVDWMEIANNVKRSVSAGDDDFDLVYIRLYEAKSLMTGGYYYNFNDLPHIDMTKPWWDDGAAECMTVDGKLYLAASAINIEDKNATAGILFNKQIAANYDVEDLYQLVHDGKWTIDKMREVYSDVTTDINGDGKMSGDDLWGFLGGRDVSSCFFIGGGGSFVARDENGDLYDSFPTDHNIAIVQKLQEVMTDENNFYNHHSGTGDLAVTDDNEYRDLFASGHGLFFWTRLDEVTTLRSMEADFGILPTPKYDEAQEDYISFVSQHITALMTVPATISDPDRTGVILEALAAESYYTVLPAYYEVALKTKGSRDDASADMLDIIFANRVYDLGEYFNFGDFVTTFNSVCENESKGIVSAYEKASSKIEKALEKWVTQIKELG